MLLRLLIGAAWQLLQSGWSLSVRRSGRRHRHASAAATGAHSPGRYRKAKLPRARPLPSLHHLPQCVNPPTVPIRPLQEYSGYGGSAAFCCLAAELALGPGNAALAEGRAACVQTLSGTGALRVRERGACLRCWGRGISSACSSVRFPAPPTAFILALQIGFEFLARYYSASKVVLLSSPTW